MKIPTELTLMGIPIKIEIDNTFVKRYGRIASIDYIKQIITIDTSHPKETVEQALIHEICHMIMYIMGEEELQKNEKFIDILAHLIYQALATAKYDHKA